MYLTPLYLLTLLLQPSIKPLENTRQIWFYRLFVKYGNLKCVLQCQANYRTHNQSFKYTFRNNFIYTKRHKEKIKQTHLEFSTLFGTQPIPHPCSVYALNGKLQNPDNSIIYVFMRGCIVYTLSPRG